MKRIIQHFIITACLLLGGNTLQAQNGFTMRFGPTVLQTSWPAFTAKNQVNNGWHIGASARFGENRFFMNPGFLYQSITIPSSKSFAPLMKKPRIAMLGFSMLGAYRIVKTRSFNMRLHAGASANYVTAIDDDNALQLNLDDPEPLHFQGVGVLGFDFYWLTLDFRYEHGLTNIFVDRDSKGNYLSVSLGFFI